jgi:hypothetical protein
MSRGPRRRQHEEIESMSALRHPITIDIPHRPGATATIQKVNGWKLEKARKVAFATLCNELMARGGAAAQKELQAAFDVAEKAKTDAETKEAISDPLLNHDKRTLIEHGLVSVSYDQRPIADVIEDFDDDDIDFAARAVLKHTKPALFQNTEEQQEAQKND